MRRRGHRRAGFRAAQVLYPWNRFIDQTCTKFGQSICGTVGHAAALELNILREAAGLEPVGRPSQPGHRAGSIAHQTVSNWRSPWETSECNWEHNRFTLGDGAVADHPGGTICHISPRTPMVDHGVDNASQTDLPGEFAAYREMLQPATDWGESALAGMDLLEDDDDSQGVCGSEDYGKYFCAMGSQSVRRVAAKVYAASELDAEARIAMLKELTQAVQWQQMATLARWRLSDHLTHEKGSQEGAVTIDWAVYSDGRPVFTVVDWLDGYATIVHHPDSLRPGTEDIGELTEEMCPGCGGMPCTGLNSVELEDL